MELCDLLDEKMRSPGDISRLYRQKYKRNLAPRIALLNLLELHAWAAEGGIKVNSRIRFSPTSSGYVFWKEERK